MMPINVTTIHCAAFDGHVEAMKTLAQLGACCRFSTALSWRPKRFNG